MESEIRLKRWKSVAGVLVTWALGVVTGATIAMAAWVDL